ncbi:MAG: T9SS type A sorting domain-containing protein, partial [Bacteroidia bacterium]|nr:T9SS type A sorting domain-containing protein [Bacteroidia bacterium]
VTVSDTGGSSGSPFNWDYVITSSNHTILFQTGTVLINGVAISTGDYLGVFYTSGSNVYCGGYSIWTGTTAAVGAWGDDTSTPEKDGFISNEAFIWKAWHATGSGTGVVVNMTATYQNGYPNTGNFTANGMSVIATLNGTYSTGSSGQPIIQSYTITQPAVLSPSVTGANVTTYGGSNGSASLTVSGGITPYTYHWSNNATTQNISGLVAGTYSVTVTDANNCSATSSVIITQPSPGQINLTENPTNNVCHGICAGLIDLSVSGGTTPYTYSWSNGATTQDLSALCAGIYTVTVTGNGASTATASVTITEPPILSENLNPVNILCNGGTGSINLTVTGGVTPYSYHWSNSASTQNLTGIPAGSYQVTVTDAHACTSIASGNLTAPALLVANASPTNIACNGGTGSINLTVSGGVSPYSYHWSNSATTQNLTGISAGFYQVTVTDSNACTSSASGNLSAPALLIANASPTNIACNGGTGSINLTVTGGVSPYSYHWSNSATTQNLTGISAGSYQVTVTDSNACTSSTSGNLTAPALLVANASSTSIACNGGTSTVTVSATGGTTPYTGTGVFTKSAGTYSYTVNDANSCTATASVTITQPPQLTASVTGTTTSSTTNTGTATLTVTGGTTPYSYLWSNSATTGNLTGLGQGTYCVTVTDSHSCTATACVTITVGGHFTAYSGNPYNPMTIFIQSATLDGNSISAGVEIAVFDGSLCVGVGTFTGTFPLVFSATMDDPTTPGVVDGFTPGHTIIFKMWNPVNQMEITNITINYLYSSPSTFVSQGTTIVSLTGHSMIQNITLSAGWNIISFNTLPSDLVMLDIVQPIINAGKLVKVLDEAGYVIIPIGSTWFSNMQPMSVTEGYYINVNATDTLTITGLPVSLPVTIPLSSGWNIMGYPCTLPQSTTGLFQLLKNANKLVKVQDEAGHFIIQISQGYWFDNITTVNPGQGYYINVNAACSLAVNAPSKSTIDFNLPELALEHFMPAYSGNPYNPMSFLINSVSGTGLTTGDEIGIFDGDICVGAGKFNGSLPFGLAVAMDDPLTVVIDGFTSGNAITIRIWKSKNNSEISDFQVEYSVEFSDKFVSQGTAVINLKFKELSSGIEECHPNPFNNECNIDFSISEDENISLDIYNSLGEKLATLAHGLTAAGKYSVKWDGKVNSEFKASSGIYYCKLITGNNIYSKKLVLMK